MMFNKKPICICYHPYEDRLHMILDCPKYEDLRLFCANEMANLILAKHPNIISKNMITGRTAFAFLVMDPSWFREDIGSIGKGLPNIFTKETADKLEKIGRTFCYQIYRRRFQILSELDTDCDSETDDDVNYSLNDSSMIQDCTSDEDE